MIKRLALATVSLLFLVAPLSLVAGKSEGVLNKLLAPGPLIEGHSDLEGSDCLKCHDAGKGTPDSKCLACHKEIRFYVDQKTGFHGLAMSKTCRECHSDHKGREFDSTAVNEKNFDHLKLTGYSLEGKHSQLKCSECHKETREKKPISSKAVRYFGKQTSCVSCHKKDDVHFFKGEWAKKDCVACHSPESWKEKLHFNHAKDAKYPLRGKHAEMKCSECHLVKNTRTTSIYKWANLKAKECLTCHASPHAGKLSAQFQTGRCNTCHTETEWKTPHFKHEVTKYPLRGKHAQIKCEDCHKQDPTLLTQETRKNWKWQGLRAQCLACHKDYHRFGNHEMKRFKPLNSCTPCHTESKWSEIVKFDHNVHTRFAVDGKHDDLKCEECHLTKNDKTKPVVWLKTGIYVWSTLEKKTCEECHANPHVGKFSQKMLAKKCTACHIAQDWRTMKNSKDFNHDKTRFPLTGVHRKAECAECHTRNKREVYKFASFDVKFCIECHADVHKSKFHDKFAAASCGECHSTDTFTKRLVFNHDATRMPLHGAHLKIQCETCHTPTNSKINLGFPDANKKQYPKGKIYVHDKFLFQNFEVQKCLACHADVHKGQVGQDCLKCHSEGEWKIKTFDHNAKTKYELRDKHKEVACFKCHGTIRNTFVTENKKSIPVVKYTGFATECSACHKDPHKGSFGPNCKECHTERGWKVTRDFHKNFTLTGVHYSLDCAECHRDGRKLAGLSQQCLACHQRDDIHYGTLPHCQDCHRQQFWEISSFRHSMSQFQLLGAHRTLDCVQCHVGGVYQGLNSQCISCHLANAQTVHNPITGFTDCVQCHNEFSFQFGITLDGRRRHHK
jgi:hypothetical protein